MFFLNSILFFSSWVVLVIAILKLLLPRKISVSAWSTTVTWLFWSFSCHGFFFSSVQFSSSVMSNSLWPHGLQHARLCCSSPISGAYSNSCPSCWWCHPTISSSVIPFSTDLQSFPASGSFPRSQLFTSGDQILEFSSPCSPRDSQESSPTPQFKSINASALSFLYSPPITSIHDYWKT